MNARVETAPPASVARIPSWSDRNQRWLIAAIARLRERIEAQTAAPSAVPTAVPDSVAADAAPGFTPALLHCAQVFGLSSFERELLLLAAGLELDQGLRTAIATLNGGTSSHASFAHALGLLTKPHWDALSPAAPLRYWQLVEPEPGAPLTQAVLRIDERVLHFITGIVAGDARLHGVARHVDPAPSSADATDETLAQRIAQALVGDVRRGALVVLHAEPPNAAAQRDLALAAVARLAQPALWITAHDLPADAGELATLARRVDREAALSDAVPLLFVDTAGSELVAVSFAGRLRSALLWLGPPSEALGALPQRRRILRFNLPTPDAAKTRSALLARWALAAPPAAEADGVTEAFERAAAQFHLGPAAVDDIVEQIQDLPPALRCDAVWPAAREAARGGLDVLAQRIVTRACFEDLVLPPAQLSALRDIARQLRHRERVYRDWGFGDMHARGQGLTALFAGESGTGKTLAAEAIANEVGLDLYRVDLAALVSKYIGETEKNLKRLFDSAETSGAVLLFDEADALFSKRSEVKDSHDRYANIEVAYLLQRVEAYRGLAILTTNMKSALDRAFLRRIRFVVTFPFPDVSAREQIWRRQFPSRAPLGNIDFASLSRLNVAGGNIHSIVLNAAFKAADGPGRIDQAVLMAAARTEFAKIERSLNDPTNGAAHDAHA